ncbi:uncharacterized protein [Spinacia oleracea]|uniref:Uncharacterized protein isoform X2 n=1 Tax=Spinacia oleracea TaxID=3562 RepID=A0ABM3RAM2_SPIOL|nr:uncharacterized protein LOC130467815 isoform X2 [Spinacia oleracea]
MILTTHPGVEGWSCWAKLGETEELTEARRQSRCRILYQGPRGPSWFLGERVLRQTLELLVPRSSPTSMLHPTGILPSCRAVLRQGVFAGQLVRDEDNHPDFMCARILLPPFVEPEPTDHDGWVPPDCVIRYTTASGSRITEEVPVIPGEEGLHSLVPANARAVPVRMVIQVVRVVNRLMSALSQAWAALSCTNPSSTYSDWGSAGSCT